MCRGRFSWLLIASMMMAISPAVTLADDKDSGWTAGLWKPWQNWKMPDLSLPTVPTPDWSLPKPKEPGFVKSTRVGIKKVWDGTKRTTRNAWETTKHALRPYDEPSPKSARASAKSSADADTGFWANLFGGASEKKKESTVNDFLRQPAPY